MPEGVSYYALVVAGDPPQFALGAATLRVDGAATADAGLVASGHGGANEPPPYLQAVMQDVRQTLQMPGGAAQIAALIKPPAPEAAPAAIAAILPAATMPTTRPRPPHHSPTAAPSASAATPGENADNPADSTDVGDTAGAASSADAEALRDLVAEAATAPAPPPIAPLSAENLSRIVTMPSGRATRVGDIIAAERYLKMGIKPPASAPATLP
jgi:hypothetical protein